MTPRPNKYTGKATAINMLIRSSFLFLLLQGGVSSFSIAPQQRYQHQSLPHHVSNINNNNRNNRVLSTTLSIGRVSATEDGADETRSTSPLFFSSTRDRDISSSSSQQRRSRKLWFQRRQDTDGSSEPNRRFSLTRFLGRLPGAVQRRLSHSPLFQSSSWNDPPENVDDSNLGEGPSSDEDGDDDEEGRRRMRDRIRGWFRSSSSSETDTEEGDDPPRMKAKFDGLFTGMPSMSEMLGDEPPGSQVFGENDLLSSSASSQPKKKRKAAMADGWFEDEKAEIMQNYENILADMLQNLDVQRREDPESVPENAEAMIKSVLKQEMDTELEETKETRARERLASYELQQRAEVEQKDVSGPITDSRVRRLVDEGEAEYERQLASQAQIDEFLRYEAEAFSQAAEEAESKIEQPEPNADLDQWALERLQDMASKQEELAADDVVLDILDENLEDLRERMSKESAKGPLQPKTMKEWQMYRAIATRLGGRVEQGGAVVPTSSKEDITDDEVIERLKSWREYNEKEVGIREAGGLSRGPKLPFEWQELEAPSDESQKRSSRTERMETRKQINRMSIEALESLMEKSDAARREKLRNEIEYLRRELESKDFLDFEEPEDSDLLEGPVDLSDVFSSSAEEEDKQKPLKPTPENRVPEKMVNAPINDVQSVGIPPPPPPPSTPFFEEETTAPPPNTPFFTQEANLDVAETDSKLGTMEDQKLEAMYRKAGAKTKEERERIKAGYEEFKLVEQEKRRVSGLDTGESGVVDPSKSAVNVSDVVLDGGDFDAQKILSAIGPRPKRGQNRTSLVSDVDEKEVASSLYRSVSAAGGGRYKDDPVARARDEASFSEYLQMEKQMRESIDDLPAEADDSTAPTGLDDEEYADQVISELGPRPTPKKYERVDERYLSDTGGVHKEDEEEEEEAEEEEIGDGQGSETDVQDVPDWVKREKELGSSRKRTYLRGEEIEDAFSDDEYEKNMRQLAEYERRRAGQPQRQMGIDISDILGPRRDIETDDYRDYKYDDDINRGRRVGWGGATFETRKRDLLDYTELEVPLLNALMEQRDAVSTTGVSRYMAKINKPFKEFGAIFRLEGVIVDISELQMQAWSRTAEEVGVRVPSMDEVKMASVVRPELAVSDIFAWTIDLAEIQQITFKFREAFNDVFDEWAIENGLKKLQSSYSAAPVSERGSLAIGEEVADEQASGSVSSGLTESEVLQLLTEAWAKTADSFDFQRPSQERILAAASMEADLAVLEVFRWTSDSRRADEIASFQRRALKALQEGKTLIDLEKTEPQQQQPSAQKAVLDQNAIMELHYRAWTAVASAFGYERPTSDEVLGAFVLNDPILVVKSGFGWTKDSNEASEVAKDFTERLRTLLDNPSGSIYGELTEPETSESTEVAPVVESSTPAFEDIVSIHEVGWRVCAQIHGLSTPTPEQVRLSVGTEPRDFIQRIMRWTDDEDFTAKISSTFQDATQDASKNVLPIADSSSTSQKPADVAAGPSSDEVFNTALASWKAVASQYNLAEPSTDQILYAMSVGPEEAVRYGFRWTSEADKVSQMLESYRQELEKQRRNWANPVDDEATDESPEELSSPSVHVNPGTAKWIQSLLEVEMECGIISHMTRSQVNVLAEYAGISDMIGVEKRVMAMGGNGIHPTVKHYYDSQQMLAAALRLERRPDHCVVVDASPGASIATNSVEMKSVAWIGSFPRYELLAADSTVSRLDELTAMNIRRLFGERIYDQPLLDMQQAEPENRRKIKTRFDWDDE